MEVNDMIKIIMNIKKNEDIDVKPNTMLQDIPLSSLEMMIIICEMEKSNGDIDLDKVVKAKTVSDLCNIV